MHGSINRSAARSEPDFCIWFVQQPVLFAVKSLERVHPVFVAGSGPQTRALNATGLPISTAFAEVAVNEVVAKRWNKHQPMR
jgi:hypothetical protein